MRKIKLLCLVLAIVMILPMVFACSSGEPKTQGGDVIVDETTGEKDANSVYDAEIHDLQGHEFTFLTLSTSYNHFVPNEIYAEELNSDKVNDAVFKRNAQLEKTYNCTIHADYVEDVANSVKEQLIAGEYVYDFIYTSASSSRGLASSNLLVDWAELDNIDLNKSWWDSDLINQISLAGKTFMINGDAGTMDDRSCWIMYFNKDYIEKAKLESPYELVFRGEWTVDKLLEYMQATWDDRNGDGVLTPFDDVFGLNDEVGNAWPMVIGCGGQLTRLSSSGDVEIPGVLPDSVLNAWQGLKPVMTSEYRWVTGGNSLFGRGGGGSTFWMINLACVLNLGKLEFPFGLLPYPKLNVEQEDYYTTVQMAWFHVYTMPTTVHQIDAATLKAAGFETGPEMCAYFMEAFAHYSTDTLKVAFYDQCVKHQAIRDAESIEMLDIALKNKRVDPVVYFNFGALWNGFNACGSAGYGTKGSDNTNYDALVSTYESRLASARKGLNAYLEYITADA